MDTEIFGDPRAFWTFVLVIAAALAYRYLPRWRAGATLLGADDLKARLDAGADLVVLDVRTAGEFDGRGGHLPGAVNLPLGDLKARLMTRSAELEPLKGHTLVVHCTGELRAARAVRALKQAGFTDLSLLKGGINAWKRRRFPIEVTQAGD